MADFYSHRSYGKIQGGVRMQPVSELQATQTDTGILQSAKLESVKPSLLIGEKKTSYKAHASILGFGQFAGTISIDINPKYKMISGVGSGTKYPHLEEAVHFAKVDTGAEIKKIYTGISTYGLGYVPNVPDTINKEVRRWPRNWYGDNIKS